MNNIKKCVDILNELGGDALILCDEANMHYLCGFSPSEGIVFVTKDGSGIHFVDSRYTETAQNNAKNTGLEVVEINTGFVKELGEYVKKLGIKSLVYEDETITLKRYNDIKSNCEGVELLPLGDRLMRERNRKEPYEIEMMKTANAIAEKSFLELLNFVEVGKTEKELAAQFDYLMAKNGSHGLSFDTILLTGAHTSMPHGVPGDSVIKEGDFVLFDFGATYKGYHSDMTRTVAVGSATDEMREMYDLVLKAQLAGIYAFNAGKKCADVYKAAYDVLDTKDMAQYFRHGLGHGVGLEIHEGFNASPRSVDTYETGNVSSIEPGIYLPDKFGIRIEDVCYLSPERRVNLSTVTKDLIIL
ncbi:MAG: aminopeptidase P family protein [Eubacterium sp.]|nr:aminopeptidase P family protein [Eubacterium sp.]